MGPTLALNPAELDGPPLKFKPVINLMGPKIERLRLHQQAVSSSPGGGVVKCTAGGPGSIAASDTNVYTVATGQLVDTTSRPQTGASSSV